MTGGGDTLSDWFVTRELGSGYWLIAEPGHVNSFLVVGTNGALLFDSGTGIADIAQPIKAITDLPLVVVNSHDHLDHRGGNASLVGNPAVDLVAIAAHPDGQHQDVDPDFVRHYVAAMGGVVASYHQFRELDDSLFFAATDLPSMRELPDLSRWQPASVTPHWRLTEGQEIDLGGRQLRVIHTPGHAPDGLCLWDAADRTLLAGDTVLAAAHWLHGEGGDQAAFAESVRRLAELDARRVLVAHNLRYELPGSHVEHVARAAAAVADGHSVPEPGEDMLGCAALKHDVDGVVILTGAGA